MCEYRGASAADVSGIQRYLDGGGFGESGFGALRRTWVLDGECKMAREFGYLSCKLSPREFHPSRRPDHGSGAFRKLMKGQP